MRIAQIKKFRANATKKIPTGLEPFSNKVFSVETVQIAHIINTQTLEPVNCFSLFKKGSLQTFFVFRQHNVVAVCPKDATRCREVTAKARHDAEH